MPDNPQPPEEPARGELPSEPPPPPPPPPTETLPPAAEPAPEPGRPSRGQRFVAHRATPIVAAGLAGLLIGGGTMAIIAYAGDDDRDGRRHAFEMHDGDGPRWERGPMPFKMLPPGQRAEKLEEFRDRMGERLERLPMREHHHDEDGNMVPGPAPKAKDGN